MSYTNETKNTTEYTAEPRRFIDYLVIDSDDYLMVDSNNYLYLEDGNTTNYTAETKNTTSYTAETKN